MKIFHVADQHIFNLKYHEEQKQVFEELYRHVEKEKPDYIILAGDLFHNKVQISPEAYDIASKFLKTLADYASIHLILGNHDFSVSNKGRLDSVTPVVNALNHLNLHFHKYTCQVELRDNFVLNVLSIVDKENWEEIDLDKEKINIALYHGLVVGVKTDSGWIVEHGNIDLELLCKLDYGFLGDVHCANQSLDEEGRIRYPGSLSQASFGEKDDKGFLIWDIKDKEDFTVKHIHIPNHFFLSLCVSIKSNINHCTIFDYTKK